MDQQFIARALGSKNIKLNLNTSDFTSTEKKEEIRYLFKTHVMPELNDSMFTSSISASNINSSINRLSRSPSYKHVYNGYGLRGIGSGEIIIYLLVDGASLGGQSSAGVDITLGGQKYEMKGASISSDKKMAYDFRLGGTIDATSISKIVQSIYNLCISAKIVVTNKNEISSKVIDQLRRDEKTHQQLSMIEKAFQPIVGKYFAHNTIFLDDRRKGLIASIKKIKNNEISIYRVTQGKIKPAVKL